MADTLTFNTSLDEVLSQGTVLIIGRQKHLLSKATRTMVSRAVPEEVWEAMVRQGSPGDQGRVETTHTAGTPQRWAAGILPEPCARGNTPSRAWAVPPMVKAMGPKSDLGVLVLLEQPSHAFALSLAVARALPLTSFKSRKAKNPGASRAVSVAFLTPRGRLHTEPRASAAAQAVRDAARWVDLPPQNLNPDTFLEAAQEVASRHEAVTLMSLRAAEIRKQGLGGIEAVGRASAYEPAFVVLDYAPSKPKRHSVWVGKGITYDTGGLSLKTKTGMPGMKMDMGGAAAVLAAFDAAVTLQAPEAITAILCVAENAIGPHAPRPDDVVTMYSGKTVEINNTDAEGRLVLADGVAWAARHRAPDRIIDLATLTGAQMVSTGRRVAAIVCNDSALEEQAVTAGKASGDLCHPLPYLPEYYRAEFQSAVADMRNSVKDRANGQASCAAQFIANHLGSYRAPWLHVDMAGPAMSGKRATGYGVGLLLTLSGVGASADHDG